MRVAKKRWGEITIKKQGDRKNKFDKTKSFSLDHDRYDYTIDQICIVLKKVIDLTNKFDFKVLTEILDKL